MSDLMKIGADWGGPGSFKPATAGVSGAQRILDAHGRFFDATLAGRVFHGGATILSINAATFTIATTGPTATPIIGLWNPATSNKYLEVLQAQLAIIQTALQSTGPGGFLWATSIGNSAITTGTLGLNALTFAAGGVGKFFAGAALTGMSGALAALRASSLGGGSSYNAALLGTAAGFQTQQVTSVENLDGSIIVPPGGVLALLATGTPVAHSAVPGITWMENPLIITV